MQIDTVPIGYRCAMNGATSTPTFAELLTQGRLDKGWSQERLADETGISRTTISRYERDLIQSPELDHVRTICNALDIDPRRAAVSIGLLTEAQIQPLAPLPAKLKEVLDLVEDPRISPADLKQWIDYLVYLRDKNQSPADAG